ncbi:hypothetical protein [Kineococcus sp. SYSU DK001]|uniref:hypothetical protein n=1 Tax=Kineococcus sp. SYSU DK001 TaxID=3383122 RepID=UPI003D7D47D2
MDDEEFFAGLTRRLREHVDPDVQYVDGAFVLHRWDFVTDVSPAGTVLDPPLRFHVTPGQLGTVCRGLATDAVSAFGGAPVQAALNLLLTHLEEALEVGFDRDPTRRHVLAEPYLAFVSDPAVPDEPLPAPDVVTRPGGERGVYAFAPLSGATHPPRAAPPAGSDPAPVTSPGQGEGPG